LHNTKTTAIICTDTGTVLSIDNCYLVAADIDDVINIESHTDARRLLERGDVHAVHMKVLIESYDKEANNDHTYR
jgi:hypothetical protein